MNQTHLTSPPHVDVDTAVYALCMLFFAKSHLQPISYAYPGPRPSLSYSPRAVVNDFVDNWGEEMLGPLAEHLLSSPPVGQDGGGTEGQGGRDHGEAKEGLSDLWPRLSRIHEGMEDLEASRTKVELARQLTVDQSNPESISHVLDKVFYLAAAVLCCALLRCAVLCCSVLFTGSCAVGRREEADALVVRGAPTTTIFFSWDAFSNAEKRSSKR